MLSAISATRLAIRLAMMAYAEVTPLAGVSPPATEAAFGALGAGARVAAARGFCADGKPLARGTPLGLAAPFGRGAPLTRAAWGGTAAMRVVVGFVYVGGIRQDVDILCGVREVVRSQETRKFDD